MTRHDIRTQWIAALRSGKYTQVTDYLHTDKGFCCLGVLCELAVKAGVIEPANRNRVNFTYVDEEKSLPPAVRNWVGLNSDSGTYEEHRYRKCLANDNDQGKSFTDIADVIASNPRGLFTDVLEKI